jgi:hypothetical protein
MRLFSFQHKQLQIASENRLFLDLINEALPEENRRPQPEVAVPLEKSETMQIVLGCFNIDRMKVFLPIWTIS